MNADDLTVVATADTEFEAETKAEVLRAEGIDATVARSTPSWSGHASISPTARGASVLVHRRVLERARALLEEAASDPVDIDWDKVDVGQREDDLPLHKVNRMPPLAKVSFAVALVLILGTVLLGFTWWIVNSF